MNRRPHVGVGCLISILMMVLSSPVGAGTYDLEMPKMAKAIAGSFDQTRTIKTIAVLDFTDLQGTVTELGRFLAEELSADLVIGQKQFDVIDRANLKRLLDENKLSRSGLVDPEAIKRLGKMVGADALVTGTITPLGNSLRVSTRIINTETARIVGAAQGDIDKSPEISELLRTRVVESGGSDAVDAPSTPVNSATAPAKKVNLSYEDKSFRATVASAFFDKTANQVTIFIDFMNLSNWQNICLAAAQSDAIFAVDDFGGQWNAVRMIGIRPGQFGRPRSNLIVDVNQKSANWAVVRPGASHRFAIVLAPRKADSPLTLNVTLGLYATNPEPNLCIDTAPVEVSVGFDGIVAAK